MTSERRPPEESMQDMAAVAKPELQAQRTDQWLPGAGLITKVKTEDSGGDGAALHLGCGCDYTALYLSKIRTVRQKQ